jgi:hypothetical protein
MGAVELAEVTGDLFSHPAHNFVWGANALGVAFAKGLGLSAPQMKAIGRLAAACAVAAHTVTENKTINKYGL